MAITIKDNRKKSSIFGDLTIGEYFMYNNCLYISTENAVPEENVCDNYDEKDVTTALNLERGYLERIDMKELVEPVDVEITVS